MTVVRAELCALPVPRHGARATLAELSALLRLTYLPARGVAGAGDAAVSVGLELPDPLIVRRIAQLVSAAGGRIGTIAVLGPVATPAGRSPLTGERTRPRRHLRVRVSLAALGPRLGMHDDAGRIVAGMPTEALHQDQVTAAAVWRAALLARGEMPAPGRPPRLGLCSPNEAVARVLARHARQLGVFSAACPEMVRPSATDRFGAPHGAVLLRADGAGEVSNLLLAVGARRAAARTGVDAERDAPVSREECPAGPEPPG